MEGAFKEFNHLEEFSKFVEANFAAESAAEKRILHAIPAENRGEVDVVGNNITPENVIEAPASIEPDSELNLVYVAVDPNTGGVSKNAIVAMLPYDKVPHPYNKRLVFVERVNSNPSEPVPHHGPEQQQPPPPNPTDEKALVEPGSSLYLVQKKVPFVVERYDPKVSGNWVAVKEKTHGNSKPLTEAEMKLIYPTLSAKDVKVADTSSPLLVDTPTESELDDMPPLEDVSPHKSEWDDMPPLEDAPPLAEVSPRTLQRDLQRDFFLSSLRKWKDSLNFSNSKPHGKHNILQLVLTGAFEEVRAELVYLTCLKDKFPVTAGRLEYISGPMFAGKSTELIRRCRRLKYANMKVILIKPQSDTRSGDAEIKTHAGETMSADIVSKTLGAALDELALRKTPCQVIAIDEAQMFDDIDVYCSRLADLGFIIITAGCETTFERKPFKNYHKLSHQAETATKLTAVCKYCHADASFTSLKDPAFAKRVDDNGILIGGADIFEPTCRQCIDPTKRPNVAC